MLTMCVRVLHANPWVGGYSFGAGGPGLGQTMQRLARALVLET